MLSWGSAGSLWSQSEYVFHTRCFQKFMAVGSDSVCVCVFSTIFIKLSNRVIANGRDVPSVSQSSV